MKTQAVRAVVQINGHEIAAAFHFSTGQLVVIEGAEIIEELNPPDSWMTLASLSCGAGWGTRPTTADLLAFLEHYLATDPRFRISSER